MMMMMTFFWREREREHACARVHECARVRERACMRACMSVEDNFQSVVSDR